MTKSGLVMEDCSCQFLSSFAAARRYLEENVEEIFKVSFSPDTPACRIPELSWSFCLSFPSRLQSSSPSATANLRRIKSSSSSAVCSRLFGL